MSNFNISDRIDEVFDELKINKLTRKLKLSQLFPFEIAKF